MAAGYPQRRTLYNWYHVLNHLNLFGGGYRAQAERIIEPLLAELQVERTLYPAHPGSTP